MAQEPRVIMAFRDQQFDVLYGPSDLVVEVRNYDHNLPAESTELLTDINGLTFQAWIFRADKEFEVIESE